MVGVLTFVFFCLLHYMAMRLVTFLLYLKRSEEWCELRAGERIFNYNFPNGFEGVTLMIRGSWLDVSFSSHAPFDWLSAFSTGLWMEIYFAPFQCINFSVYIMNKIAKLEESLAPAHNFNLSSLQVFLKRQQDCVIKSPSIDQFSWSDGFFFSERTSK